MQCGMWTNVSDKSIEKLDSLQNTFLQKLLGAGRACPLPALCWDTATLGIGVRVRKAKLALIHHIRDLDETSLAKQIYEEQLSFGWPGLVEECGEIIKTWGVLDIINSENSITKNQWKIIIKKEAKIQNGMSLSKSINENYSKLECMKNEVYEEKPYLTEMSMWNARLHFSLRTRMFPCKMNYMNNPKYKAEL